MAGIHAVYYKPSLRIDYEESAKRHNPPKELVDKHSSTRVSVKWKDVCNELGIRPTEMVTEEKEARVLIKTV
jgi:hypothetical protein